MVGVWSHRYEAAWALPRGDRGVEQGRVGYVNGRPEPTGHLGLGAQRCSPRPQSSKSFLSFLARSRGLCSSEPLALTLPRRACASIVSRLHFLVFFFDCVLPALVVLSVVRFYGRPYH